jgi:tRNA-modifying protein YgfZ
MVELANAVELKSRSLLGVVGPDWRAFLQGLLSQDVETLAPGEMRFGALLTPQGKLLFDLFILGRADGCWLDVAADRRDALAQRLALYKLRAKVEIAPVDASIWALWPADGESAAWPADPRMAALGARGYGEAPPTTATISDDAAYATMRLGLGVPDAGKDCPPESAFPIEANFDLLNGIDFQKGCFVGQETTSRMKRRGVVKTRMLPIVVDGQPPSFGAEVLAGSLRAGEVRSGIAGRAMALLRLDRIDGAELSVEGRSVTVERPAYFGADV